MSIEYKVLGRVAGMWHYSINASYYYQNVNNMRCGTWSCSQLQVL